MTTVEPREEDHPLWRTDQVSLVSFGLDIGSATSQAAVTRLRLRRMSRSLSTRYMVVERDTWYRSPVRFTPFQAGGELDGDALAAFTTSVFAGAGIAPADVDTGVIILTGEAAGRGNARIVADVLADGSGRFVSVAAGHKQEAVLAAHGSGAVALSHTAGRVLNVDIGGGTTKFAVAEHGVVRHTAALHVGGRLATFDQAGRVDRLERAGAALAGACGRHWAAGVTVAPRDIEVVGAHMAEAVLAAVRGIGDRWLTAPLPSLEVDAVVFSGGVAEYVYGVQDASHGDLGQAMGTALAARLNELPAPVAPASARLRATVVGAAEYTVQVSGNTIHVDPPSVLPLRNLRVVRPRLSLPEVINPVAVADQMRTHLAVQGHDPATPVAIALDFTGDPSFPRLRALAAGLYAARAEVVSGGGLLCLVFDHDVAQLIGRQLRPLLEEADTSGPLVVIDGVILADLDFIDISAVMPDSGAVAITVKSLLFGL